MRGMRDNKGDRSLKISDIDEDYFGYRDNSDDN